MSVNSFTESSSGKLFKPWTDHLISYRGESVAPRDFIYSSLEFVINIGGEIYYWQF